MSLLRRPVFNYGTATWEARLPARPWHPRDRTIGGRVTSQAGIPASYVVRRDNLLELTVRFFEPEWADVLALVTYGQTGAPIAWWPDAEQSSEPITAYLERPAVLERWAPIRVGEFPRVLEQTLLLRALTEGDTLWRQYSQIAGTLPPGVEYVTVQGEIVTVDGEPVTIGGSGGGGGGLGEAPGGGGGTPEPGGGEAPSPPDPTPEPPPSEEPEPDPAPGDFLFLDGYAGGVKSASQNGVSYAAESIGDPSSGDDIAVVADAGNPSGYALGFTYGGNPALWDDVKLEQFMRFPDLAPSAYVEMRILTPANYDHRDADGPDNNKLLRLWDQRYGDSVVHVGMSTLPLKDGTGRSQLIVEYADALRVGTGNWNTGPWTTIFAPGQQYDIGFQVDLASGLAIPDGRIRVWVNDVLVYDRSGLALCTSSTTPGAGNFIRNGYLFGWSNSGFTQTTTMRLRRLLVARRRIAA